jgi:hypothetical protein
MQGAPLELLHIPSKPAAPRVRVLLVFPKIRRNFLEAE